MWLPEGSELAELWAYEHDTHKELFARFANGQDSYALSIYIYESTAPQKYYKSDNPIEYIEIEGTTHNIIFNNKSITLMWIRDNYEFSFVTTCSEDGARKIIKSIYSMEGVE